MISPDLSALRRSVEAISEIHRPSASEGELTAAKHISSRLSEIGIEARIETERATGSYWLPLGLLSLAGIGAGLIGAHNRSKPRHRSMAAIFGTVAALSVFDDVSAGARPLRKILPDRATYNVVAEMGPDDAERVIVIHSHHEGGIRLAAPACAG